MKKEIKKKKNQIIYIYIYIYILKEKILAKELHSHMVIERIKTWAPRNEKDKVI